MSGSYTMTHVLLAATALSTSTALSQQDRNFAIIKPGEPLRQIIHKAANVTPSARQLAWQQLEFIAFAHFGMNTFMDQEWGKGTESPFVFSLADFDARQWVKVIKDAGMKLLIITAKHHDGFCLWPSKYTEHSVKHSPWKEGTGDVVGEVAKACREAGLKFGIYLSPWDRHEPTYGDSPVYNEYFRNQLRELLTNYGEISEVWFDGANGEGPNGKRGRITSYDIKSLVGMRKILDRTFKTNLASRATISASNEKPGHNASSIIEQHPDSYWITDDGVESATIEIQLPKEQTFDRLMLQENISVGQRIEAFRLEAWSGNTWKAVARGTTVGYKRLLRFPAVAARKVRLVIDSSRTSPTLSSFGLYESPPAVSIEPDGGSFENSLRIRISCDSKNSSIHYTVDGSEPTLKSQRYAGPIELTRSAQVRAVASTGGELAAESADTRFTKCLKVKSVVFEKTYSQKYPGRGDTTVIDGRRGSPDFQDKEWLGFNGDDVVATLDLGEVKGIHRITIGFLQL